MRKPARFRQVLLESVDNGLVVLGVTVRQAIYERIENRCGVKGEDIPEQLGIFHKVLGSMLGTGAGTLESLIARNLYKRLSLPFTPCPEWTLIEYVDHAMSASESGRFRE